jgi:hypothetical protein
MQKCLIFFMNLRTFLHVDPLKNVVSFFVQQHQQQLKKKVYFDMQVTSFGVAQLLHGLTIAFSYILYTLRNPKELGLSSIQDLKPQPLLDEEGLWLERTPLRLACVFSFQSIFKHCLTEGDRIVLSLGSSLHNQV